MEKVNFSFWSLILCLYLSCLSPNASKNTSGKLFVINKNQILTYDAQGHLLSSLAVEKPYRQIVLFYSSHAGYLEALGAEDQIAAVSRKSYFYHSYFDTKSVVELGDLEQTKVEALLLLKPDLVILPPSIHTHQIIEALTNAQIDFLILADFQAKSPLDQAEFIYLFGHLIGKPQLADSIYQNVKKHYHAICSSANLDRQKLKQPPVVMSGMPWQGNWTISSSSGWWAQMIRDIGAQYFYPHATPSAVVLTPEQVMHYSSSATHWVNTGIAKSKHDIAAQLTYTHQIPPFKSDRCFNNVVRVKPNGANDFWERGVVYPDSILLDLYHILYDTTFRSGIFYQKL